MTESVRLPPPPEDGLPTPAHPLYIPGWLADGLLANESESFDWAREGIADGTLVVTLDPREAGLLDE